MIKCLLLSSIALSLITAGSPCAENPPGGVIERGVLRHLTAVAQSGKLAIHYEPNRWMKRLIEHYVAESIRANVHR